MCMSSTCSGPLIAHAAARQPAPASAARTTSEIVDPVFGEGSLRAQEDADRLRLARTCGGGRICARALPSYNLSLTSLATSVSFLDRAAGTLQSQFLPGVTLQEQIFFPAGGPFIPAASGLPPSPSSALYRRRAKCDRRAFLPTKWGFPLLASFCAIPWWKLG